MIFEPAFAPTSAPTAAAWSFAFVDGQLLLPEGEEAGLVPGPLLAAEARHYLG